MYVEFRAVLLISAFWEYPYSGFDRTKHGFLHRQSYSPRPPLRVGPDSCLGGFIQPPIHRTIPASSIPAKNLPKFGRSVLPKFASKSFI
jgi:hypothetical protein